MMLQKDSNGQYVFPVILLANKKFVDYQTLLDITGLPSTTMFRLLKKINYRAETWKNRKLYDLEFAVYFWQKIKPNDIPKD